MSAPVDSDLRGGAVVGLAIAALILVALGVISFALGWWSA